VSHGLPRDRIATHILAFEGESKVTFVDGTARGVGRVRSAGAATACGAPRVEGTFEARRPPQPHRSVRNISEYEEWRKQ
jgi:hypothetical protein